MFIAHAPAGYLLANLHNPTASKTFLLCAVIANILPDADLLYFYLIDHRKPIIIITGFMSPFFGALRFLLYMLPAEHTGSICYLMSPSVFYASCCIWRLIALLHLSCGWHHLMILRFSYTILSPNIIGGYGISYCIGVLV